MCQGALIHGSARLIFGAIQAQLLAIFIVIGWQFWGQGFAVGAPVDATCPQACIQAYRNGDEFPTDLDCASDCGSMETITPGVPANLPDTAWCSDPSLAGFDASVMGEWFTWYLSTAVFNIPLNILCLVNVYIRPRDLFGPFMTGQVGLLMLGYLQFQCTATTCVLPGVMQNGIAAFAATSTAMLNELLTGLPSAVSVIPVLFIFAPGSAAVLTGIASISADAGGKEVNSKTLWGSIVVESVSYMVVRSPPHPLCPRAPLLAPLFAPPPLAT